MTAAHQLTATDTVTLRLAAPAVSADVVLIPFDQTRRSGLNPRKTFSEDRLKELAQSIFEHTKFGADGSVVETGIQQNLLGRPHPEQGVEIVAGERRQRAVELLVQGFEGQMADGEDSNGRPRTKTVWMQVGADYPMPFSIKALTDAELIELATLENYEREDMTLMETADAFMALKGAGRDEGYIALKFAKHPSTVRELIRLAAGLGKEGRRLLEQGQITAEQAKLIASTSGALKKSLVEQARHGASFAVLRNLLKQASFAVEHAVFDVAGSGLRIDEGGLLGDFPAKFSDPKAALSAQAAALEQVKAQEEATGAWHEVLVLPVESEYGYLPGSEWVASWNRPEGVPPCLVLAYSTVNGKAVRHEGVARADAVRAWRQQQQDAARAATGADLTQDAPSRAATPDDTGKGVREAGHVTGHQVRSMALDAYFATHERECLALACATLLQTLTSGASRTLMGIRLGGRKPSPHTAETQELASRVAALFPSVFTPTEDGSFKVSRDVDLYDALTAEHVTTAQLVSLFTLLTHREVGAWEHNVSRPGSDLNAFAHKIGAAEDVKRHLTLSAEFLQAYRADDLMGMIATMPESQRPAPRHNASKKDIVALILEKADALKEAGWTPDLVKFQR
ncbi:ParB/RepB/Spo0J family partition protein [Deinococcus petrolearius]|uniref:ParB/RepB/Spo0J family partition protein n=1 Tax=Deinococcus petrolearius TaxID=1751295 RepID=A0ABW1DKV0_9DEIO